MKSGGLSPADSMSKEDAVYERLLDAILSGAIGQGQRLVPADLTVQLQASSIPIRNALTRLEAEQLVVRVPNKGFSVRPFSVEEVQDLYTVLVVLECLAARLAAARVTEREIADLRQSVTEMECGLAEGNSSLVREAIQRFHRLIHLASGNQELAGILGHLIARTQRYRAAYHDIKGIAEDTVTEHRSALAALEARDADRVEEAIRRDIETTAAVLVESIGGAGFK